MGHRYTPKLAEWAKYPDWDSFVSWNVGGFFSQRTANAFSFGATMCKYSFVWYTDGSGWSCSNARGRSDPWGYSSPSPPDLSNRSDYNWFRHSQKTGQ